jgi:hypothetical protein
MIRTATGAILGDHFADVSAGTSTSLCPDVSREVVDIRETGLRSLAGQSLSNTVLGESFS